MRLPQCLPNTAHTTQPTHLHHNSSLMTEMYTSSAAAGPQRVVLKPSPSLVNSALCALGEGLAYIHTRSAAVVGTLPPVSVGASSSTKSSCEPITASKIEIQDYSLVQAIRSCVVDGVTLLALGNEQGLQVWDVQANNLLFVWKLPRSEKPSQQHADFVKSLAFNMADDGSVQLCAGCSSGSIQVFSVSSGISIRPATSLVHSNRPVVSLASAFQSRRGGWADDIGSELVSCDDAGTIRVWRSPLSGSCVDAGVVLQAGVPCCSLAVRKGFIVAAGIDGCVRVYNLKTGRLRHELVAHSRWLAAMDIHPGKDIVVTAAEDCTLGVWQLPVGGAKAACLLSACSLHDVLTGVAFCGRDANDVAAVAYDADALLLWRAD